MRESDNRGIDRESRSSALWGTGGRGGDSRSSALWGKGGRGSVVTAVAIFALAAPIAASAQANSASAGGDRDKTFVQSELTKKAKDNPNELVRVIVTSNYGGNDAEAKTKALGSLAKMGKKLGIVDGIALKVPAKYVSVLAKFKGLNVTVDAPNTSSGTAINLPSSDQLWPHESGNALLWATNPSLPTIAIVDSGIEQGRADFSGGARVLADVNLVNPDLASTNSPGDGRGHGTFVAGIAAGSATGKAGAAPKANLVSLDVMNDQGMAYTSDVIAAANWILQNKAQYNIKVANFSLHSTRPSNFSRDPLDRAVEKLWFSGVTVVAAAGNYGNTDGSASRVRYAPGNDPFVITVGAIDLGNSARVSDDTVAPWSAWGRTYDGFSKPEIGAAGRYMVGPVPTTSTLYSERPTKVVKPGYMELSGTSFAAPVIAGTAAYMMALHPTWGPDQVKGALMKTARPLQNARHGQSGVGELNAVAAAMVKSAPNPNKALDRFLVADPMGGSVPVFDDVSWYDATMSDISWDSVSWGDVSWGDVSWLDVSWLDVSWGDVSWDSVSWLDVSWSDVSWGDVSWLDSSKEDAVLDEAGTGTGVVFDAASAADVTADPDLNVDPTLVDEGAVALLTSTSTTSTTSTVASTTSLTSTLLG
jgi:serine protease AprX